MFSKPNVNLPRREKPRKQAHLRLVGKARHQVLFSHLVLVEFQYTACLLAKATEMT